MITRPKEKPQSIGTTFVFAFLSSHFNANNTENLYVLVSNQDAATTAQVTITSPYPGFQTIQKSVGPKSVERVCVLNQFSQEIRWSSAIWSQIIYSIASMHNKWDAYNTCDYGYAGRRYRRPMPYPEEEMKWNRGETSTIFLHFVKSSYETKLVRVIAVNL